MHEHRLKLALTIALAVPVAGIAAAELKPHTVEAFDRYVRVTEERMRTELEGEAPFLWIDRQEGTREEHYKTLRSGQVVVQKLETRGGRKDHDLRWDDPPLGRHRLDSGDDPGANDRDG